MFRPIVSVNITAVFLFAIMASSIAGDERTRRLVEMAHTPGPTAMDVELLVRYPPPPQQTREQMRKDAERAFDELQTLRGRQSSSGERERFIELNISKWQSTAGRERISHKRIRYRGILYREDRSWSFNGEPPPPESLYEETVVNVGNPAQGDFTSFEYGNGIGRRRTKTASIQNVKGGQYTVTSVWNLLGLHDAATFIVMSATSDGNKITGLVHSQEKTKALEEGTNPHITVKWEEAIVPGTMIKSDKCSIFPKISSTFNIKQPNPAVVIYFDAADYRRDWRVELRNPYTGKLATVTVKSDFDHTCLPRRYEKIEYPGDEVEKRETMEVISARAVPEAEMDQTLFEFNPPDDYERADFRKPGPVRWVDSKGKVLNQWQIDAKSAHGGDALKQPWTWRLWVLIGNVLLVVALVLATWLRGRKAT